MEVSISPWMPPPSMLNDLAREYMAGLNRRLNTRELKMRGDLAKSKKPRKKRI